MDNHMALRGATSGVQCPLGCVVTSGRVAPEGPDQTSGRAETGAKICLSAGGAPKKSKNRNWPWVPTCFLVRKSGLWGVF